MTLLSQHCTIKIFHLHTKSPWVYFKSVFKQWLCVPTISATIAETRL